MPQNQDEQPYPGQQQYGSGPGAPQRSSGDNERGRQHPPKPAGPYAPQPPPGRSAGTYPPQHTPGAAGPYPPPQPPVGARFIAPGESYPQPPAPRQHSPTPATPPLPQRPPEQLFLGSSSRAEPPQEARQVVRHARARSTAAALFNVSPEAEETLGMIDYALVAMVIFLLIAVIVVFLVLFGKSIPPPDILTRLLIGAILYAGCVFGGYLWGRYQADTETKRENVALRQNIDLLQDQLDRTRNEVRSLRVAAGSQQPYTQGASRDYQSGRGPAIVAPRQIEQQQPVERIYDKMRDPDGYSEQDRLEFPHEKAIPPEGSALKLTGGWKAVGASRRGYSHSYEGSYREDDFNIVSHQGIVLVAIADGVSSKSSSRFGARAAVLGATMSAEQQLFPMLAQALHKRNAQQDYQAITRTILLNSLQSAYVGVEQQARARNLSVDDLQSTLLVFLAAPLAAGGLLVASVQVGDGALFALEPDHGSAPRDQWSFLQQPQIQAAGNEVQPFMTSSRDMWEQVMQVKLLDNPAAIMGMTDGTADDIEPPPRTTQNPDVDPFFLVHDFYKHIQTGALSNGQPGASLLKFLSYKKKGSADDRTVVCLYR